MTSLIPWRKKRNSEARQPDPYLPAWYDRFFSEPFFTLPEAVTGGSLWRTDLDIREGKKEITVEAEIPGMNKEDIHVSLHGRNLNIKGEKSRENETTDKGLYRKERSYGFFNRTVELPAAVDESSISATYKKGVLTVEMKKSKEAPGRAITIKTSAQ